MQRRILKISIELIGLLAVSVSSVRPQATKTEIIEPDSLSPFSIARAINQKPALQTARLVNPTIIEVDLSKTWKKLGIDAGLFETCSGNCDASVYHHELDGHPGREVILKLSIQMNTCRYLVFRKPRFRTREWKLLGYIDHDFNRYQMARHRVVRAFGKSWLIVRGQEGSGSGYSLYGETWYSVNGRGVTPVLHYSQEGHTYSGPGGLNWELRARPNVVKKSSSLRDVLRLNFVVNYTADGFEDSDFTRKFVNRRVAYYVWNKRLREFVFDVRHSTISEREMEAVANTGTEPGDDAQGTVIGGSTFFSELKGFVGSGFEVFLRLNVKRLLRIARNTNTPSYNWLQEFLKQCDNTAEKRLLEKVMQARLSQSQKQG